jgi:hypothetical protein
VLLEIKAASAIFVTAVASSGVTRYLVIFPDKDLTKFSSSQVNGSLIFLRGMSVWFSSSIFIS